jgi:hypothetical protein
MGWRFFAASLDRGDEPLTILHSQLPLRDVQITTALSGVDSLSATISPEWLALQTGQKKGEPILEEWGCAIWAEADGQIAGGGILVQSGFQGSEWRVETIGYAGYAGGMPFTDSWFGVEIDALDVVRKIWDHLQEQPGGNLGLVVDPLMSGVLIGTELDQGEYDEETGDVPPLEDGPIQFNWWSTHDLGRELENLAVETPFDFWEEHRWNEAKDALVHRLRLAHPRAGRRRTDLRFVVGENIMENPSIEYDGEAWANEILFLGAGEGRMMVRGQASQRAPNRLRRVKVVQDKTIRGRHNAYREARTELAYAKSFGDISEIVVADHPHAPIGSWHNGDEIRVRGNTGWIEIDEWFRVMSTSIRPDDPNTATIGLERSEAVFR